MKPTTIQMTCFNFFVVINELNVLSVTHFFQMMVDFTSLFFNSGLSALIISDQILTPDFSDFNSEAKSIMAFAILSGGLFELKSFVPT